MCDLSNRIERADHVRVDGGDVQDRPRAWLLGVLLALPLAGLVLLLAVPSIDVEWEHHPSHFLLVSVVALINVALASSPARRHVGERTRVCSWSRSR
jgi:hypothetical protein